MPHRSRLSRGLLQPAELSCFVCHCTENNACILEGGVPCSWVTPGLCSNPECMARIGVAPGDQVTRDEEGNFLIESAAGDFDVEEEEVVFDDEFCA
jgi:hypothetical protein